MAGFEYEQPDSLEGGSKFLKVAGKWHMMITGLEANPIDNNEKPIDGLKVTLEVLDGTDKAHIGHIMDCTLYRGKPEDKDQGKLANKKLTRLGLALGGQYLPGGRGVIDTELSLHRQIVVETQERISQKGKPYADISYAEIYHVDDPVVIAVPKSQDALKLIPAEFRKTAPAAPPPGQTNSTPAAPASTVAQSANASPVSLDDI